jgi:hypothetical protein
MKTAIANTVHPLFRDILRAIAPLGKCPVSKPIIREKPKKVTIPPECLIMSIWNLADNDLSEPGLAKEFGNLRIIYRQKYDTTIYVDNIAKYVMYVEYTIVSRMIDEYRAARENFTIEEIHLYDNYGVEVDFDMPKNIETIILNKLR